MSLSFVYVVSGPTTSGNITVLGVFGGKSQAIRCARLALENGEFISTTVSEMELSLDYVSLSNLQSQVKTWENV